MERSAESIEIQNERVAKVLRDPLNHLCERYRRKRSRRNGGGNNDQASEIYDEA